MYVQWKENLRHQNSKHHLSLMMTILRNQNRRNFSRSEANCAISILDVNKGNKNMSELNKCEDWKNKWQFTVLKTITDTMIMIFWSQEKRKKDFGGNHTWIAHATVSMLPTELQQITYWSFLLQPLQNPTLGVLVVGGGYRPRTPNRALDHCQRSWGVRHCAEGCIALRWWKQCCKWFLQGTRQHPVVCMPSTYMGLCWWWLFNAMVLVGLIWTTRYLQTIKWQKPWKGAL
jgi:hypothetical protein